MRLIMVLGLSFLLSMAQGCALWGAGFGLTAKKNDFPVTFSEGIFGHNNELIGRDDYEVVYHFTIKKHHQAWNFIHAAFSSEIDLSDEFEGIVRLHNGEAIVNLKIKAEETVDLKFARVLIAILTCGLIAPWSAKASIEGDVIRLITPTPTSQNDSIPPQ
ncbi:MAG: hypothetical protein OEY57_13980 [Nitrospirota bacterium]|nr:hypothetical protein [Nitrospirota bacterium]